MITLHKLAFFVDPNPNSFIIYKQLCNEHWEELNY